MKDRIRSGAGFQRSLRFLNSDEQGMDSLELRLAVSRRILPALNRICERRFLRISFTSPGQVFVSPDGSVRLIVKDQSQVYQLKNLLPTLHREVEKACGFPVPEITVGVNPRIALQPGGNRHRRPQKSKPGCRCRHPGESPRAA